MKNSTSLFHSFNFSTTFLLVWAMTLLLGLMSVGAFAQPCSSCNSCNNDPDPTTTNPDLTDFCNGFKITLVLDESSSIAQVTGAEEEVEQAVSNFLGAVSCGNITVSIL